MVHKLTDWYDLDLTTIETGVLIDCRGYTKAHLFAEPTTSSAATTAEVSILQTFDENGSGTELGTPENLTLDGSGVNTVSLSSPWLLLQCDVAEAGKKARVRAYLTDEGA